MTASTTGSSGPGKLTVPADVVAKIAAQAASELPEVGAAAGGVLGIGARRDFENRPRSHAELYGNTAVVSLDVGLTYPTPLRTAADTIRGRVRDRVGELTGFTVEQVDVTISWLHLTDNVRGVLQ